jgi:hypothetical protein
MQPRPGEAAAQAPAPADQFAQAAEAGSGESGSFTPNMFGDQFGSSFSSFSSSSSSSRELPIVVRGSFKITENESPKPQDRAFVTYNYYNNLVPALRPLGTHIDVHRETVGLEKTLLDGNASVGVRLPYLQVEGSRAVRRRDIGDLTFIGKYAVINDCHTGNVLAGGLAVTVPTGENFIDSVPDIHPTLLQPYVGGIYHMDDLYVQAFSSIVVPTDSKDVTTLFNDLGIGYFVYRSCQPCDSWVSFIAPTFEAHLTTPLNQRGSGGTPVGGVDILDLTGGVTVGLGKWSTFAVGVVTPVTGPKPFDVEAQAYFNLRF